MGMLSFLRRKKPLSKALKVIGAVSAVIGLLLGIAQVYGLFGDWWGRGRRVADLVNTAESQAASGDYSVAWNSLEQALQLDPVSAKVRIARVDLAMQWLRDVRVSEVREEKTLSEVVDKVAPVLHQSATTASGERAGDIYAHLGWANYLKWREGWRELDVTGPFTRALKEDPANAYANAMWGFWMLYPGTGAGDLREANEYFAAARKSGRELPYVRRLHLQALLNRNDQFPAEMIRVADEMRRNGDSVEAQIRQKVLWNAYSMRGNELLAFLRRASSVLPAKDHLATLLWLRNGLDEANPWHQLILAQLKQETGDVAGALEIYEEFQADASKRAVIYPAVEAHVKQEIVRLRR